MKISIIGTGYVGLVSGVCLAEKGHEVTCVDLDLEKIAQIRNAVSPIYERGLDTLLKKNIGIGLNATAELSEAVRDSEVSLIAVGTPFDGTEIDLQYIREASRLIGNALKLKDTYHLVVVKSTVVPGTTDEVVRPILEKASGKKAGKDFGVGMNPEFLREGEAVQDFLFPDRIVLGGMDEKSIDMLEEVYQVFPTADKIRTNNRTAEMIKYAANSLLATMISFANEIGNLCSSIGNIDVVDVMKGVHLDKRLSPILSDGKRLVPAFTSYLAAGCGFGGSCFPKDVMALIAHGKKSGVPMELLDAVMKINKKQPERILSLLGKHFESLEGKKIAVLGLAFKPGTDDMRESPSIPVVNELLSRGARITAYDPVARNEAVKLFGNHLITYPDSLEGTIKGTDAVVLMTRWDEFRGVPAALKQMSPEPLFIDGRRMLEKSGFSRYEGIGL
jgi:UDPglucose 6-dehydrogenase